MGRRGFVWAMFVAVIGLSFVGVGVAHRASAQLETAPPTVVPEFVTPSPTPAPFVTQPPVVTPVVTLPPINVGAAAGFGITFILIWLIVFVFYVLVSWRIYTKAGEPGWASLIPIYNVIVLLKIAGKPWWWIFILWLVVPTFIAYIDLAHRFGKSTGFGIGLVLLSPIFFVVLAFGDAEYEPAAATGA